MGIDIEQLIKNKRSEMDVESPPESLWGDIESGIHLQRKQPNSGWVWKAAAIGLLLLSGSLFMLYLNEKSENERLSSLGDISQEYDSLEERYKSDITQIESKLQITQVNRKDFSWLFEELDYLEQMNKTYKEELSTFGDKEKVVNTLIDYYEKKLKILKRLELEIQRKNNEENSEINI